MFYTDTGGTFILYLPVSAQTTVYWPYFHDSAASKHEIPSFFSISAMLLKEKFVLPDSMRLTYCGDTPNLAAISERLKLFACI